MRILYADSDEQVLRAVELSLRSENFNVYAIDSGEEAVDLGKLYGYDAIVLGDTADISYLDVVRQLRASKVRTPILIASSLLGAVAALTAGADDYMTRPFHVDELVARLHSLIRRSKGHVSPKIKVGNVVLDIDSRTVQVGDTPLHLTGKEYAMFELLMLHKGAVQSKENFLNYLYGGRDEPELKIIDVFICKLRRKLAGAGLPSIIETVWGRGYLVRSGELEAA